MKTSFTAIASLILGASMAYAAFEPAATMAPRLHKRQQVPDGLDLSALLANPSSYLKHVSSVLDNPKAASEFAKVTANPKFEKSISKELVSQFGTKTAAIALQQYTAALGVLDGSSATASSGSNNDASASAGTASAATATPTSVLGTTSSSTAQQISGAATSGASTSFTLTLMGSAVSLGTAVVLAVM